MSFIFRPVLVLLMLVLTAIVSTKTVSAKTLADIEKIDKASELFMTQIQNGEVDAAYSIMSAYVGVSMEKFLERGQKVSQDMKQFQQSVGKPLSYAMLDKQAVGEHFYKVTYLLKYETAALIWELNYYQPAEGWKLVDVSFHADVNKLFK